MPPTLALVVMCACGGNGRDQGTDASRTGDAGEPDATGCETTPLCLEGRGFTPGQPTIVYEEGTFHLVRAANVPDYCQAWLNDAWEPTGGEHLLLVSSQNVPMDTRHDGANFSAQVFDKDDLSGEGEMLATYTNSRNPEDFLEFETVDATHERVSLRATFAWHIAETGGMRLIDEPAVYEFSGIVAHCAPQ